MARGQKFARFQKGVLSKGTRCTEHKIEKIDCEEMHGTIMSVVEASIGYR